MDKQSKSKLQIEGMLDLIDLYNSQSINLRALVSGLEGKLNATHDMPDQWYSDYRDTFLDIDQEMVGYYAEKETGIKNKRQHFIDISVADMESFLRNSLVKYY